MYSKNNQVKINLLCYILYYECKYLEYAIIFYEQFDFFLFIIILKLCKDTHSLQKTPQTIQTDRIHNITCRHTK